MLFNKTNGGIVILMTIHKKDVFIFVMYVFRGVESKSVIRTWRPPLVIEL